MTMIKRFQGMYERFVPERIIETRRAFYTDEHGQKIDLINYQDQTSGFWQSYTPHGSEVEEEKTNVKHPSLPHSSEPTFLDGIKEEDIERFMRRWIKK